MAGRDSLQDIFLGEVPYVTKTVLRRCKVVERKEHKTLFSASLSSFVGLKKEMGESTELHLYLQLLYWGGEK